MGSANPSIPGAKEPADAHHVHALKRGTICQALQGIPALMRTTLGRCWGLRLLCAQEFLPEELGPLTPRGSAPGKPRTRHLPASLVLIKTDTRLERNTGEGACCLEPEPGAGPDPTPGLPARSSLRHCCGAPNPPYPQQQQKRNTHKQDPTKNKRNGSAVLPQVS